MTCLHIPRLQRNMHQRHMVGLQLLYSKVENDQSMESDPQRSGDEGNNLKLSGNNTTLVTTSFFQFKMQEDKGLGLFQISSRTAAPCLDSIFKSTVSWPDLD